jgi:branched-subunit amino acid aminotransferase/4-amino-4-deoxychorismate lyase
MAYVVAQQRAQALGADEALLVDAQGSILEAAGSNVFARFEREGLCTPALTLPILPGITREHVFEWIADVHEHRLTAEDLYRAEEVFLTNSVRGVVPIVSIDGHRVGTGGLGAVTIDLTADFMVHWYRKTRTRRARKLILRPDGSK